jgi:hypothetical protein
MTHDHPTHRPSAVPRLAVAAPFVAALLAGCTGALNQSDDLLGAPGADPSLPDLAGTMPGPLPADEGPSLTHGHDRSHWTEPHGNMTEKARIVVVERQVEVQPWYVSVVSYDKGTARARGEAPTAITALEVHGDGGAQALEGVAAPFWAAFDLLASPVRMVILPPWSLVRVPETPPIPVTAHAEATPAPPAADATPITPPAQ